MKITLLLILLSALLSCSETKKEKAESYDAGFKTIKTVDKSRIYKPNTDTTDNSALQSIGHRLLVSCKSI